MRFGEYWKDRMGVLLMNGVCMLLLFVFLLAMGNSIPALFLIFFLWVLIVAGWLLATFFRRKKQFDRMDEMMEQLDRPYLFAELMGPAQQLEDRLYQEFLRRCGKAAMEEIRKKEDEQKDYKDFMESWVHEAKNPLTAMELLCENLEREQELPEIRRMRLELRKMEGQIDKVLYYARMEQAWKDYLIVRTDLHRTVLKAVQRNRLSFMDQKMQVSVEMEEVFVSTDEKWILFILDQIFSNCVKYSKTEGGHVRIFAEKISGSLRLCIEDDGIGIREEEIGRIFQKGFSGTNGRSGAYATGFGLYLCRRLCDKLGMGIKATSEFGVYTRVELIFPDSDFQKIGTPEIFQN